MPDLQAALADALEGLREMSVYLPDFPPQERQDCLNYIERAEAALKAAELGGLSELTAEALENPTTRMLKVIKAAEQDGWTAGRISTCVRLSKPDDTPDRAGNVALPFYATWELRGWTPKGRPSWGFLSAAAANLQPLSEGDILAYLANPSVIYPEPPPEGNS